MSIKTPNNNINNNYIFHAQTKLCVMFVNFVTGNTVIYDNCL